MKLTVFVPIQRQLVHLEPARQNVAGSYSRCYGLRPVHAAQLGLWLADEIWMSVGVAVTDPWGCESQTLGETKPFLNPPSTSTWRRWQLTLIVVVQALSVQEKLFNSSQDALEHVRQIT